jgi:signal transduction histidine kinase
MSALASQPVLAHQRSAGESLAAPGLERLSVDDLRELMRSVTDTTQRLQDTHIALHQQVARLQGELAEANAALRRSQSLAALGEMAAGIAHEVRNPLASIQLYVQTLAENLGGQSAQVELCRKIDRAVGSLDAVVRDVLSFARDTTLHCEPTTSSDLLERALESCAGLVDGHQIIVVLEEEPRVALHADVNLMTQALANVVRNAIEAMIEHKVRRRQLRLWAARRRIRRADGRSEQRIALCVQDSGPGIPRDVRDRIFNPFFTTRETVTGLCLAFVILIL